MLTIVDYNAGNPTSVQRALSALSLRSEISADADTVRRAERIIFPGVGHAASAKEVLVRRGLDQALLEAYQRGTPLLGICVGAQLGLGHCEEGDVLGLGLVAGSVRRFPGLPRELKIPHMGWNRVNVQRPHPVLADIPKDNAFYFVHSYYLDPERPEERLATTHHGIEFCSAVARNTFVAVQFHPEKSGPLGLALLERFAQWTPSC